MNIQIGGSNPGYFHIDIRALQWTDLRLDWVNIHSRFINCIDELLADQVIEHLTYPNQVRALESTLLSLKPGGKVVISTPDILALANFVCSGKMSIQNFQEVAYGSQDYEENSHRFCHTVDSLYRLLSSCGYFIEKIGSFNGSVITTAIKPTEDMELAVEETCFIYRKKQ